jgi:hypothetical protein
VQIARGNASLPKTHGGDQQDKDTQGDSFYGADHKVLPWTRAGEQTAGTIPTADCRCIHEMIWNLLPAGFYNRKVPENK